MKITWLSNKGSSAPVFYLFLQGLLLSSLALTCPTALDFNNDKFLYVFWIDVIITIIFFFILHRSDPGYVPVDAVFFTDQEEPPLSASNHHYNSMIKLKMADSRMLQSFDLSPSGLEGQMKQSMFTSGKSPADKSKLLKSTSNSTAITKQGDYNGTLNSPLPPKSKQDDDIVKNQNPEDDELQTRVEVCLSRGEGEEESQGEDNMDYQAAIGGDDDDVPVPFVVGGTTSFEQNDTLAPQIKRENQPAIGIMKEYRGKYGPQLDDVEEEQEGSTTVHNRMDSNDHSQKADKTVKTQHSMEVDQSVLVAHLDNQDEEMRHKHRNFGVLSQQGGNIEFITLRETNAKSTNYLKPNDSTASSNVVINMGNLEEKWRKGSDSEKTKSNPALDKSEHDQPQQEGDQPETLYVERRYCSACNFDQPLRSKHCKECHRCTAQYDHHCPWTGTCIGEKNHLIFYFFLFFQGIETLYGEIILIQRVIQDTDKEWTFEGGWRIIVLLGATFFTVMVTSLFVFHSYLATQNLTTWEYLSWNKISYIKEWNKKWGSPFSQGFKKNLQFFFRFNKDLTRWKMPKFKAPLSQQQRLQEMAAAVAK